MTADERLGTRTCPGCGVDFGPRTEVRRGPVRIYCNRKCAERTASRRPESPERKERRRVAGRIKDKTATRRAAHALQARRRYAVDPAAAKERQRIWNEAHPGRTRALRNAAYANHPEVHKMNRVHRKYGLTAEQFGAMNDAQGGLCAICGKAETKIHHASGTLYNLAVDHDHETGAVRGLLCCGCNVGLGYLHDDPETLIAAIAYLTKGAPRSYC